MSFLKAEHNLEDKHGLWLIHEPRDPLRPVCDIVAVHGLGGGPASTWTHKETHYLWLRDCLPTILEDIPRGTSVRIWTFGYNANTVFGSAVAGITEFTQSLLGFVDEAGIGRQGRRVIWVAHSLGGVVVKSALIDAGRRGSQHSWLLDATIGIVFLATPHQGSHIANRGLYLANIAKYTGVMPVNREVLKSLKQNSGELFDKADQFRGVCGQIKICTFFETETLGSFGLIVERRSASIGVTSEELCPLNANHKTICKFKNSADMNLRLVQNKLKKMVEMAVIAQGGGFSSPPIQPPPGPGRVGLYRSNGYFNNTQPSYEHQSDTPYPDNDSTTSFSSYDDRPSTSTSYQSFDSDSLGGQSQTPWRSPQPSYASSRRDPSPSSQRGADLSNREHMWSTQTPPPPNHTRTASSGFLNPSNQPQPPSWAANTSAARVAPPLRPRPSGYSLNREQLDSTNRMTGPAPARKPVPTPPAPPATPPPQDTAYMCDVCLKDFGAKTARFHCTVCDDYDLCPTCYQKDLTSKGHNTAHKMLTISTRETYNFNDITPAVVIPETTAPRTLPNWSVDTEERRWLHLRTDPSHERYIIHGIPKGAYLVQVVMHFKFSSHVSVATLNQLKGESVGEMTVVAGAPTDTSVFFKDPKTAVSKVNLTGVLMASGRQFTSKLEIPQQVTDPSQVWEKVWDFSATPILLGTGKQASKNSATLAILLQWSDVRKFQTNDNPVLLCTIDQIRMDELLEYDEPAPTPTPPPAPTRAPVTATAEDSDDEDDHVTLEELLDATKMLIDNNKPVTPENLLTIVMATREVQGEIRRALLLKHIQQVQQQQRAERERRERAAAQARVQQAQAQQAAEDLLLLGLLLSSQ